MKKGFTLIELLAVIVVLSIIALIAVPIVQRIIKQSEEGARQRSVELYGKAVENALADYNIKYNTNPDSCIINGENLACDGNTVKIDYKGSKVECDIHIINDDKTIYLDECKVGGKETIGKYGTDKLDGAKPNGYIIYFDVLKGQKCRKNDYHIKNSYTGYYGTNKMDNEQTSCLKFYVFNDNKDSNKINLLLDHNTKDYIAIRPDTRVANGPSTESGYLLYELNEETKEWKGTLPLDNYINQVYNYTVDYSGYKARIITAQEVAKITGADNKISWTEAASTTGFCFETLENSDGNSCNYKNITEFQYGWLYDRTNIDCEKNGCLHNATNLQTKGYWTLSAFKNKGDYTYAVKDTGSLDYSNWKTVDYAKNFGIRPVIEVSKDKLK